MSILNREFVYFTGESERKIDFSGAESSLSFEERMDFLKHYQQNARKWYDDDKLDQKTVSDEAVKAFLEKIDAPPYPEVRREIRFDTMTAYEEYIEPEFEGVHTYMDAHLENGEIIFPEKEKRGTPCALFEIEPKDKVCVSLEVFIPEDYLSTQRKWCGDAQGGRVIELRVKTVNKAKIKICNTGEVLALSGKMWAPTYTLLGSIEFGKWNKFTIVAGDTFEVSINDGEFTKGLVCIAEGKVDNIFFDGGMFARGEWRARNITVDGNALAFKKNSRKSAICSDAVEVSLPYAIGSVSKKNRALYLTKKFEVSDFEYAELNIETLDPCGKVWVNDKLVLDTKSFMAEEICISDVLKRGENEIKIMVSPRAPETYYFWHRHTDCYNGWYCGSVSIMLSDTKRITDLVVKTDSVNPVSGNVIVESSYDGDVRVYAREIFPQNGDKIELGKECAVNGKAELSFTSDKLKIWSPESPVIYAVYAELYDGDSLIDDLVIETGFRTISQKNGGIYLNDERTMLNGALLMQFLPPFDEVPINHNCPTDYQIAMQMLMLKEMNGNFLRLHMLGYGSNDKRYARVCDRLGIMLAWTTRLIDSLEEMAWDMQWRERDDFVKQLKAVMNYPSIIMYEGSNEYHSRDLDTVDRMYRDFVGAINEFDKTRLLSPCSHLYYGGGIYEMGCCYFTDDGKHDQDGNYAEATPAWTDEKVVRSAHTYDILCGYGSTWEIMRKQNWKWQPEMLGSQNHSYLITEYAITALPNPDTDEARALPYQQSYERGDEIPPMGRIFEANEWRESQAMQALCAAQAIKHMRILGIDGMAWCCLMSGANNGSYMKPPIDFYGYKKLGFYSLRDGYRKVYACKRDINVSCGIDDVIEPVILTYDRAGKYDLTVRVLSEDGALIDSASYNGICVADCETASLSGFKPKWTDAGYYTLEYELSRCDVND